MIVLLHNRIDQMKIRAIITGSTGMVGKGVLLECLESDAVESVLVINRTSLQMQHPKLKEIIHQNFLDLASIKSEFKGYNACFHCMGISSLGIIEEQYIKFTYDLTSEFVNVLYAENPDLVFNYVSGAGTDSTEKGSSMWARVKGKTENMVLGKGFKDAYAFRPGAIIPEKGVKSKAAWINTLLIIMRPLFPLMKGMKSVTTTSKIGQAMINSISESTANKLLEAQDINRMAEL